jgi:hypothetical protein
MVAACKKGGNDPLQEFIASRARHRRARHFVTSGLFDSVATFRELEARIAGLPTERDRGDAFEVFAEAYLATQKIVGAEQVWPGEQIPNCCAGGLSPAG